MNESDFFSNMNNHIDENEIHTILDSGINQVTLQSNRSINLNRIKPNTSAYKNMKSELASIQSNINRLEQKLFSSTTTTLASNSIEQSSSSLYPSVDYKEKLAAKENEMIDIKMSLDEQLKTTEELTRQLAENDKAMREKEVTIQEQKKQIGLLLGYKDEAEKLRNDYHLLLNEYQKSEGMRKEQKMIIRELQRDIDNMRQEALNRICQMKYDKDIRDMRENNNVGKNGDFSTRKTNRSKSPQPKPIHKENKAKKGIKHKKPIDR